MTATTTRKVKVADLRRDMEIVTLEADDPNVERMVQRYRDKFSLGPRDRMTERAEVWRGVKYQDRILAIVGERVSEPHREGQARILEVTAALYDETKLGKIAFLTVLYLYRALLETGKVDEIHHSALGANVDHWAAIIRETGDFPEVLIFRHRRKATNGPPA